MLVIELMCATCGKIFERRKCEVDRQLVKGRKTYCSRSCCGKEIFKNIPEQNRVPPPPGSNRDEYSGYRIFHHRIRKRRNCCVTVADLKEQWEKQKGVCPYTGWRMEIPSWVDRVFSPRNPSLDRIDSKNGYTKDNIEFVCLMAQYAKNTFSREEVIEFCRAVAAANP